MSIRLPPTDPSPVRRLRRLSRERFFRSLGYEPHAGQRLVHSSTAMRRVLACGVRWGKTRCAGKEALAAAMDPTPPEAPPKRGWVVAPSYELADKVFREMLIDAHQHFPGRIIRAQPHLYRLDIVNLGGGTSEIRGKSADNPASLLGEGLDWLVIDEAARLKPQVWDHYLSQRLIDKKGWALMISTPKGKGWYYQQWRSAKARDEYEAWNSPSWDNPHLDRELIERERERIPERAFRQEYGAEFIEGAGSVFRNVTECAGGKWERYDNHSSYVFGLDLAKVEDFTVLCVFRIPARSRVVGADPVYPLVYSERFQLVDWPTQVTRIKAALEKYGNPFGLVDSTGVGDPILDQLRAGGVNANGYKFTSKSKHELIDNGVVLLEREQVAIPPDWDVGLDELASFEYSVSDAGNVKSSAPPGMHDDCVMAFLLGLMAARKFSPLTLEWV